VNGCLVLRQAGTRREAQSRADDAARYKHALPNARTDILAPLDRDLSWKSANRTLLPELEPDIVLIEPQRRHRTPPAWTRFYMPFSHRRRWQRSVALDGSINFALGGRINAALGGRIDCIQQRQRPIRVFGPLEGISWRLSAHLPKVAVSSLPDLLCGAKRELVERADGSMAFSSASTRAVLRATSASEEHRDHAGPCPGG
jgi:hypothetical protein